MPTVSHVGAYQIVHQIGSGGMAPVFLAVDTRTGLHVALKLLFIDSDRDGQQILEMESGGARLQEQFSRGCRYVPAVYECAVEGQYFYIAMEHLSGQNLSEVIGAGPLPAGRAARIATQLCEFLEAADSFTGTLDGRDVHSFLHGDLKPRNIRVLAEDEIKVFDFGIAKALSLSRKVTRNDFGSSAYMSPERIESGNIDAQAEFWAVGVLLYEMVSGAQPFRASDTGRLEQRIRERRPPPALDTACPAGLQAIIGKLLTGNVADRYGSARAIREDLQRFMAGTDTQAQREGWPARTHDEPPTRRTHRPGAPEEEATHRTRRDQPAAVAVPGTTAATAATAAATAAATVTAPAPVATVTAPAPVAPPPGPVRRKGRKRRVLRTILLVIALWMAANELRIYIAASALATAVSTQDFPALNQTWVQHEDLTENSLEMGGRPLERALTDRTIVLAEAVMARYRNPNVVVRENHWKLTREALAHAVRGKGRRGQIYAALHYCDGHIRRIDGEARSAEKRAAAEKGEVAKAAEKDAAAQQELTAAVTAFREAAELRQNWPDPFLGLMRTFIALEDLERGADALEQAQRYGYKADNRDWLYLAEGYLARATKLAAVKELDSLMRAADACKRAVELYSKGLGYRNAAPRLRDAQRQLTEIEQDIEHLSLPAIDPEAAR